jgi:UDP:flavonoid glycosyltransferase YjiC (YdhE family)
MKVYFGACGVGLGHVGRCVPVAKQLLKRGSEVLFSTYSDACDYVDHEGLPFVEAPPIHFAVREDGGVDFRKTTAYPGAFSVFIFLDQVSAEIKYMRGFRPDIVVSDSRASTIMAAKLLGVPVLTVLNLYRATVPRVRRFLNLARIADGGIMTVVGRLWNAGEEILIPDFPSPYTLSEGNLVIPPRRRSSVRLIGPILNIRSSDLPSKEILRQKLHLGDKPVIFVPISGPAKEKEYFTVQMLKILSKFPEEYEVVVSLANPNHTLVSRRERNVTIYDWLPNRFEYLKACDAVISRAGLGTITQSICFGKPSLIVPTPSHTEQLNNSRRAEELGVAKVLDQLKLDYDYVLSGVRELFEEGYVERAERLRRDVSKFDGMETMVETIERHSKVCSKTEFFKDTEYP